jgi:hypothetical protein
VESALSALAERVKTANQDPDAQFRVAKAVAFSEFLGGRAPVRAPDIGIQLILREPEGDHANLAAQAARTRFLKQLRGGTAILSLHPYEEYRSLL